MATVTRDRCLQAINDALDRLRMLAEISSMAEVGAHTLAQLLGKLTTTSHNAQLASDFYNKQPADEWMAVHRNGGHGVSRSGSLDELLSAVMSQQFQHQDWETLVGGLHVPKATPIATLTRMIDIGVQIPKVLGLGKRVPFDMMAKIDTWKQDPRGLVRFFADNADLQNWMFEDDAGDGALDNAPELGLRAWRGQCRRHGITISEDTGSRLAESMQCYVMRLAVLG
ncbi:hypothetical protein AB5N19_04483 [Seiridium cardinale]